MQKLLALLETRFRLSAHGTNPRQELIAGLTTFAAMAYILAVNPSILSAAGMPVEAVVGVTALAAAFGCFLMASLTNYPIALAPGMGTNAYFAFIIVIGMGIPWESALGLVFWNGLIFLALSLSGVRRKIAEALPHALQIGIQAGIGFFIAIIGMVNAGIVIDNPATLVDKGDLTAAVPLLALLGLFAMAILTVRKVPGAILLSIAVITIIGFVIPAGGDASGMITKLPEGWWVKPPDSIAETAFQLDLWFLFREPLAAIPVIFTLLLLDMFDSVGTLIGVSRRAKLLDKDDKLPKMDKALTADAVSTSFGALMGTSTTTSYIESATGVEAGGKTGLTAVVVGICFLLALFLAPVIGMIPAAATAPALMIVGLFMAQGLRDLDFEDFTIYAPGIFTAIMIPLTYSITDGIALGLIFHVILAASTGKVKTISVYTWAITIAFIVFFALD